MESVPKALCAVSGLPLRAEADWLPDIDELRRLLRPNTRLVAVNFPNNPTGAVPDRAAFQAIVDLCADRGLYLFSDEVYRGVERDPACTLPQAADLHPRALSLGVMSKAYGLPGLRIGWIACRDRFLLSKMERLKHYLSISNAGPSEVLSRIALKNASAILERNRALCADNLRTLDTFFARYADLYDWKAPPGSCVAYPRYKGSDGVESHCQRLLEEAGVLLLPASIYASDLVQGPTDRFRVGFGRANIERGLDAWSEWLDSNAPQPR